MSAKEDEAAQAGEFLNAELHSSIAKSTPPSRNTLPPPTDSVAVEDEEEEGAVQAILRQSAHPTVATFHVLFKLSAIISYLILGLFTKNFVVQFVVTVTLLAFDFWIVKNVTGRLLVGLRWWHEVGEDGVTQQWRFESIPDRENLNAMDSRIFWWTLYLSPVIWVVLGVVCILKFNISYLLMVVIALTLNSANIIGYYKCNKDATEQIKNYIGTTMLGHAMERSGLARFPGLSGRLSSFV